MTTPQWRKSPPGTRVERLDPSTNMLLVGTVMDIPFPDDLSLDTAPSYTILFDNCTSTSISLLEMADIIPKPPVDIFTSNSQDRSFAWTLKSLTSTMEHITKVVLAYKTGCIGSCSNLMSANVKKIGVSTSLISQQLGLTCASRVFSSLAMSHILFFVLLLPLSNWHLIPSLCLSVQWISNANALQHYLGLLQILIQIARFGYKVIMRKSKESIVLGPIRKSLLVNIQPFPKKGAPKAILLYAFFRYI